MSYGVKAMQESQMWGYIHVVFFILKLSSSYMHKCPKKHILGTSSQVFQIYLAQTGK